MANPPAEQSRVTDVAVQVIQKISHVHLNLEQNFIFTTEDKMRLCLKDYIG
jgi:hypothetical protein